MNRPRLPLALLLVGACADEEFIVEAGVHIDLEIEPGREPCGDLVGHMDDFIELVADAWQVDLDGRRFTYRWLSEATYRRESPCGETSVGCAGSELAWGFAAPIDHELVHLVSFAVGRPPSFYVEGAATAFELPLSALRSTVSPAPIADVLTKDDLSSAEYLLAGNFTRHLIDRFGMPAYLEFYGSLEHSADLDTIAAAHEAAFAEPLTDTIAVFDAMRRDCKYDQFRLKLFECAAAPLAWEGDTWTLRRSLSCADDDVVGPFDGARATTYASFDVAEPGLHEVSAVSDGIGVNVRLGSCGGCEAPPAASVFSGAGPRRIHLEAGPHYLKLDTALDDTIVSLRLRRIAD